MAKVAANKSSGTIPPTPKAQYGPISKIIGQQNPDAYFYINYTDDSGQVKTFNFMLLPAIEGQSGGKSSVPGARSGIETNTVMRVVKHQVPGCGYITQSVGVKEKTHYIVGAFVGNETVEKGLNNKKTPDTSNIYKDKEADSWLKDEKNSAFYKANLFQKEVAESGRPITLVINNDIKYTYKGIIISFKKFDVRANQTFYSMEILATD